MDQNITVVTTFSEYVAFWSAIAGAIVGGLIAYFIQIKVLREGRKQREEDLRRTQQVLGNSLIVKMIKIYSNIRLLHKHLEDCFRASNHKDSQQEPWQFYRPLVTLPNTVFFSSEEMSMLVGMKNDHILNLVLPLDTVHNTLLSTVANLQKERAILLEQLKADKFIGEIGTVVFDQDELLKARPQMISINQMFEGLRAHAKRGTGESKEALYALHKLLRDKLELHYNLEDAFSNPSQ